MKKLLALLPILLLASCARQSKIVPMPRATAPLTPTKIVQVVVPKSRSVHFAWDASAVDATHAAPDGYRLWWGTSPGTYSSSLDAKTNLTATVTNLTKGATYYLTAEAYRDTKLARSTELRYLVPTYDVFGVGVTLIQSDRSGGPWVAVTNYPAVRVVNTNATEFYSSKLDIWIEP